MSHIHTLSAPLARRATAFDTTLMTRATHLPECAWDHLAPGASRTWHCSKCKANHPEDWEVCPRDKTICRLTAICEDAKVKVKKVERTRFEAVFCLARGGGGGGGGVGGRAVRAHDKFADATDIGHSSMRPMVPAEHATYAARHESGRANTAGIGLRLHTHQLASRTPQHTHTTHTQHRVTWSNWSPAAASAKLEVGVEVCNKMTKQREALDSEQTSAANVRAGAEEGCIKWGLALPDVRATQCPTPANSRRQCTGALDCYMDKFPSGSALEM